MTRSRLSSPKKESDPWQRDVERRSAAPFASRASEMANSARASAHRNVGDARRAHTAPAVDVVRRPTARASIRARRTVSSSTRPARAASARSPATAPRGHDITVRARTTTSRHVVFASAAAGRTLRRRISSRRSSPFFQFLSQGQKLMARRKGKCQRGRAGRKANGQFKKGHRKICKSRRRKKSSHRSRRRGC